MNDRMARTTYGTFAKTLEYDAMYLPYSDTIGILPMSVPLDRERSCLLDMLEPGMDEREQDLARAKFFAEICGSGMCTYVKLT